MTIQFSKEDARGILYYSFCNYGLSELASSSVEIDWVGNENGKKYSEAKRRLQEKKQESICLEDVYVEILDGNNSIVFTDYESEENIELTLDSALEKFNALSNQEKMQLAKLLDEDDTSTDAWDAFNALQYALFGEVIFG